MKLNQLEKNGFGFLVVYILGASWWIYAKQQDNPFFFWGIIALSCIASMYFCFDASKCRREYQHQKNEFEKQTRNLEYTKKTLEREHERKLKELQNKFKQDTIDAINSCERERNQYLLNKRQLDHKYTIETKRYEHECELKYKALVKEHDKIIAERERQCKIIEDKVYQLLKSTKPFSSIASIMTDAHTYIFDETERYLKNKIRPALTAAKEVKLLKAKTKECYQKYKEMLYKFEFLLSTFPELQVYVDDEDSLVNLSDFGDLNDFEQNRDHAKDYITDDEWNRLSVDERNQLALNRYKQRPKTNWQVGIEYEQYIEYKLRNAGYKTIPHGSLNGINDLGRDIIAEKLDNGRIKTYIIQCKLRSKVKEKYIHENVVCQIFGTTLEYSIRNKLNMDIVIPVIYTNVPLSQTAKIFAETLNVKVFTEEKGDYPMIKCNIHGKDKIYHLPFDQQYYSTKIEKAGEFYAWTVAEASSKGFRRALRHLNTD